MKAIKGIAIILAFLALGEVCSILIGRFIPASVMGMILLFAALCLGIVKADSIRELATFLTDNMTIFFIPAVMGKIEDTRRYLDVCGYSDIDILIDGNVSFENIPSLVEAGATMLVGGSYSAFRKGCSIVEAVGKMRELCKA